MARKPRIKKAPKVNRPIDLYTEPCKMPRLERQPNGMIEQVLDEGIAIYSDWQRKHHLGNLPAGATESEIQEFGKRSLGMEAWIRKEAAMAPAMFDGAMILPKRGV